MLSTQSPRTTSLITLLALALWAVLAACGPATPALDAGGPGDAACLSGRVEVGGSGGRFVALPRTGGELDIVLGPQGGIHVLVGFRLTDLPLELTATYRLRDPATGADVAPPTLRALGPGLYRSDATGLVRVDDLIVLDNDVPRVEDFAGRELSLELEVVTASGLCAGDQRLVTLR